MFLYMFIYRLWLFPKFGYFGFEYNPLSFSSYILVGCLVCVPALFLPRNISRPSIFIYWLIYITVYVPSLVSPFYILLRPYNEVLEFAVALAIGNSVIALSLNLPVFLISYKRLTSKLFWQLLIGISCAFLSYVLFIYRNNLRLVSFADAYDLRFEGGDLAQGNLVGYVVMMLSGCFFPLFMAEGIVRKKYTFLFFGICGQIILYATAAMKGILLSIPIIICLYFLSRNPFQYIVVRLMSIMLVVLTIILLIPVELDSPFSMIGSIVFMRTLGVPGLLSAQYHDFFLAHPLTYWSHVNGINLFVHYPYDRALGLMVGRFYSGDDLANSNANFWLTDGIAADGLFGVVIISIFISGIFYLIDTFSAKLNLRVITLWVVFVTMNLGNTSIFTTLLSGGLGFIIFLMAVMPNDRNLE